MDVLKEIEGTCLDARFKRDAKASYWSVLDTADNLAPTGSRYIGGDTHKDSDIDLVALYKDPARIPVTLEPGGSDLAEKPEFQSYRDLSGMLNVIVCDNEASFNKWVNATEICRQLQVYSKEERIAIFDHVLGVRDITVPLEFEYPTGMSPVSGSRFTFL